MTGQVHQHDRGDVLVLMIDNPPVNASSGDVRAGLLAGIRRLSSDPAFVGGVVIGAGGSFVAGSDLTEFDGPVPEPLLPEVIEAIEACPKPVVAAVEGVALGGGLELALGCDVRIATEGALVGLPEVTLGLVPGAGGTQRLPRLVGRSAALGLIASGRRITAVEARRLGIVDQIAVRDLVGAGIVAARGAVKRRVTELPVPEEDESDFAQAVIEARGSGDRPWIDEAIALVHSAGRTPISEGLADERTRFNKLRTSQEARALRHRFLTERAARRAPSRPS